MGLPREAAPAPCILGPTAMRGGGPFRSGVVPFDVFGSGCCSLPRGRTWKWWHGADVLRVRHVDVACGEPRLKGTLPKSPWRCRCRVPGAVLVRPPEEIACRWQVTANKKRRTRGNELKVRFRRYFVSCLA